MHVCGSSYSVYISDDIPRDKPCSHNLRRPQIYQGLRVTASNLWDVNEALDGSVHEARVAQVMQTHRSRRCGRSDDRETAKAQSGQQKRQCRTGTAQ